MPTTGPYDEYHRRRREEIAEKAKTDPCYPAELEGRSNGQMIGGGIGFLGGIGVGGALFTIGGPAAFYAGSAVVGVAGGYVGHKGDKTGFGRFPSIPSDVAAPIAYGILSPVTRLGIPVAGAVLGASVGGDVGAYLARRQCENEREKNEAVSQLPAIPGAAFAGYSPVDVTADQAIAAPGGTKPAPHTKGRTT